MHNATNSTIWIISQHLQGDGACFFSLLLLLPLSQPVLLINEEVLGPQLLIRAYRLSVRRANQSKPSDSWVMKNVAQRTERRLEKLGIRGRVGGSGVAEKRREVKEHSICSKSGHGCTTALNALTVDSLHGDVCPPTPPPTHTYAHTCIYT